MGTCRVAQASLKLQDSSDPPTSVSRAAGTKGMCHHTRLYLKDHQNIKETGNGFSQKERK